MKKEKISKELLAVLLELDNKKLVKIIEKQANKNTEFLNSLKADYLDKEETEAELYDRYEDEILDALVSNTRYSTVQLHAFQTISKAVKILNEFCKNCKNKNMEADLLKIILDYTFENYSEEFSTCWTKFDNKVVLTFKRMMTLVSKKLHPDYMVEYNDDLRKMYDIIKKQCRHLDSVYGMEYKF